MLLESKQVASILQNPNLISRSSDHTFKMPPNDDIIFTSRSTLRVPHFPPSHSHSSFRFSFRNMASQFDQSCHSIFQFIDSVKRGSKFTHFNPNIRNFWPPLLPFGGSNKTTRRGNSVSRRASESGGSMFVDKSSLILSASLSLIQSDVSSKAESGTHAEHSGRRQGMEDKSMGFVGKSSLLCSASLALSRTDEPTQSGSSETKESPQKGYSAGRQDEERVLISEVLVRNKDGEELERKDLEMEVLTALKASRPNSALTVREVQEDVHRIINSGYFYSCIPVAVDTRDGIRLIFQVEPNQEFQGLVCEGANVLPAKFLEDAFRDGYGKVVNLRHLDEVISSINSWYGERGLFGRVSAVDILSGGILSLQVSEAEVNNISIRFLDKKTGEPIAGNTKSETILRQLTTKKGQVYSMLQGKRDAETVLTMGIMEDVSIIPQPAADAGKVDILMNVVERPSGGFSAGGGLSCGTTGGGGPLSALIGSFAYSHRNLFGRNQKLHISLERGQIDSIFRINYTDPWIEGDDKRTSRTIMVQNSRTPGTLVHGGRGNLTIGRVTAGLEFNRPIRPKWSGTAGLYFQRAGARDEQGNPIIKDAYNSPLTASGNTDDNMLLAKFESVYTGSGDHGSSMCVLSMEQGLPFLPEWLCFNRVNARVRSGVEVGPSQLLLTLSGGHVVGNFCPHEAFAIGGTNSVRGYEEGAVGSGRSYAVGCGEISFPLLAPVEGVIFVDYGTDLGSGPTVPGDPAGARLKPGSGYGYGFGIRLDSPLGPLRLEYAFNDRRAKRFHFGVGHRN